MTYTDSQISRAKKAYFNFLRYHSIADYDVSIIGMYSAQERMKYHNSLIDGIKGGNKSVEKKWKLFFLTEEVKSDNKKKQRKIKLDANKEASSEILAPIKAMRKLGAFGKWLNTQGNPFRKEHFNKKYTLESVNAFLAIA